MDKDFNIEVTKVLSRGSLEGIHTIIYYKGGREIARELYDKSGDLLNLVGSIPDGPVKEYYQTGYLKEIFHYSGNKPEGCARRFYYDGQIWEDMNFKNGKLDGPCLMYYMSGVLWNESFYSAGKLEGVCKTFYENGELEILASYSNGQLDGEYKMFYNNGNLMEVSTFRNNVREGFFTRFYDSGEVELIDEYSKGEVIRRKRYAENGSLLSDNIKPVPEVEEEKRKTASGYFNEGIEYAGSDCYEKAIDAFRNVIKLMPECLEAYHRLSGVLKKLGAYPESIEVWNELLKIDSENSEARFQIGLAQVITGNRPEALQQYHILKTLNVNLADELKAVLNNE